MSVEAWKGTYQGEQAVWLKAGAYEAAVLPGVGANLIALRDVERGYALLREPQPEEMAGFKASPMVHGIPVLFPPNRYDGGRFEVQGTEYAFPVNEPATGNHLHGLCYDQPWETVDIGSNGQESYAQFEFKRGEGDESYTWFPHPFRLTLRYSLTAAGLVQQIGVYNDSDKPMPCMLGFHTAVNAPFAPGSTTSDCSFTMSIGERWELDGRMLPTERTQPLSAFEQAFGSEGAGASPFTEAMDNHYSAKPGPSGNRMVLTDSRARARLVYDAGMAYKQWMIWNDGARGGFFCPEPQINMVNAPNLSLPAEQTGLVLLEPGCSWSGSSRLYVESID
ncbi:aldose 1-epimerase [Paenibacillus koleovorans]|uniref:aldose 1-epimerase n=1 Tax=Paenibacillus koleovorans TaxID=121608 RepID=UPI000FD7E243|nr:aldose 1-epimerase [Paenibacillus koleovorans]